MTQVKRRKYHTSFFNPSVALPTSQDILQPFHCFIYATAHSQTLFSHLLCHRLFTYITWRAVQLIKPFRHFIYVTAHSQTLPSLYQRHNVFSKLSVASSTPQLILQPFYRFSYVTGSSLTSPGEPQSSFSNLSVTSSTPQLILKPFLRFTYFTTRSPILPLLHLSHSSFSNPFAYPTSQALHLRHMECHLSKRPTIFYSCHYL